MKWLQIILILVLPQLAQAESYKIGLAVWTGYPESVKGFKDGLEEYGLIEGKNVEYIGGVESSNSEVQKKQLEMFNLSGVDLVYSLTTPGTILAKSVIPEDTPIVFSVVTYPADSGLIESFEYSGNNLVGTSNYVRVKNYVKLMNELFPNVGKVAVFHRSGEPNSKIQVASIKRFLRRQKIDVVDVKVNTVEEVKERALELGGKVDVFISTTDTLMQSGGEEALIKVSLKNKIPIVSPNKSGIESGSTVGVVSDFYLLGKISGRKAGRILLEGKKPYELQTELQDPPIYLLNRSSLEKLGVDAGKVNIEGIKWAK